MNASIPKGTRDFLPEDVVKRKYMFGQIEAVFKTYGYIPIETPTMENLSTLTGKSGEEGDKLLFKVLNNGDFLQKADQDALSARNSQKLAPSIARRGMRYDLTVPFARFVVMHQNEIQFPFKRYQIQPVWRADRPQKGRYQEFYQCDVDVVGSDSLVYEAELALIYDAVFSRLNIPVTIRINNRKILAGIAEVHGILDQYLSMTMAIDKLDKIGREGVKEDLIFRSVSPEIADSILDMIKLESIQEIKERLVTSEMGRNGIEEIERVFEYLAKTESTNDIRFDVTLARGLNYYTGCIFEVDATDFSIGSLGGGGRYDDLTGVFGMKGTSGVGISFGAERIFDVMTAQKLFPENLHTAPDILFLALDNQTHQVAFNYVSQLRISGISADIYPDPVKMKKQMKYANATGVQYVAIIGEEEMLSGKLTLKNMHTGAQRVLSFEELVLFLQSQ
jgi:histidyl-tRNA synthetase